MLKINIKGITSLKNSSVFCNLYKGVLIFLPVFIFSIILASGGKNDQNWIYLLLIGLTSAIVSYLVFKKNDKSIIKSFTEGLIAVIGFAIFDYLLTNLLLFKNSFEIYKFWGTYLPYLIVFVMPAIKNFMIDFVTKKFKKN